MLRRMVCRPGIQKAVDVTSASAISSRGQLIDIADSWCGNALTAV
jgi:hypothetical protein